jgi:signal transduction histidine kinase
MNPSGNEEEANQRPHLSISSHVVVQLGEELVTDVEQALLELTKNAYDADSETCDIVIEPDWTITRDHPAYELLFGEQADSENTDTVVGRLQVIDHGDGLSEAAVKDGWLRISSSIKRPGAGGKKEKTPSGRTPVGDKGLGRLATMKIGTVLRLKTALDGEHAWRTVAFSWKSFTPDRTLEMVPVFEGKEPRSNTDKGTIIEVIGLRDRNRWADLERIEKELIPRLSSLISPFQEALGFAVTITHGKHYFELAPLAPELLNLAAARFSFSWDGEVLTHEAKIDQTLFRGREGEEARAAYESVFPSKADEFYEYVANPKRLGRRGIKKLVGDGTAFIELSDSDHLTSLPTNQKLPGAINPGPLNIEFHYFLLIRENVQKLKTAGVTSTEQLKAMAGVGIFRDGFRISTDRDWIGMSEGQTSGGSYYGLRPSNTVGYVTISNEHNPWLIEKSDREAFVDNPEYRGFMLLSTKCRDYANGVLEVLRRSFNAFRKEALIGLPEFPTPKKLIEGLANASDAQPLAFQNLESEFVAAMERSNPTANSEAGKANTELRESAKQLFRRTAETVQKKSEQIRSHSEALSIHWEELNELNLRLTDAAAAGLSARSLAHELHQYVRQYREATEKIVERNKEHKDEAIRVAARLLSSTTRELGKTVAGIDPLLPGTRVLKEKFNVHDAVAAFVDSRKDKAESEGIALRYDGTLAGNFTVLFSRSRFLQILENLFQNSVYWLRRGPLCGNERQILVEATAEGFVWSDNGPGIKPSIEGALFDAFISDKPKDEGQGLGLHIVTTFLELERCSIRLGQDRNSIGRRYKFEIDVSPANPDSVNPRLL